MVEGVLIGPDKNVYVVIGDLLYHRTMAQNLASVGPPDLTSGVIRATQEGNPAPNSQLGNTYPSNLYYAYGIRNSSILTTNFANISTSDKIQSIY
jgi:aldose sugar dehydrogenase